MANSSINATATAMCEGYDFYHQVGQKVVFVGNYFMAPVCHLLSALGHCLCLLVYYGQTKRGEKAYRYQLFLSGNQLMATFQSLLFHLVYNFWSGLWTGGAHWFMSCYGCMWYTARVCTTAMNLLQTLGLMSAVSMAADRVFALSKPFVYRNIDNTRHQVIALISCLVISVAVSSYDIFRTDVAPADNGTYVLVINTVYMAEIGEIYVETAIVVRLVLLALLITLNACTIHYYRSQKAKQAKLVLHNKKEVDKKSSERTLTVLCICQSVLYVLDNSTGLIAYLVLYVDMNAYLCGDVAAYILYIAAWMSKAADFYIPCIFSGGFRKMVLRSAPFLKVFDVRSYSTGGNQVSP